MKNLRAEDNAPKPFYAKPQPDCDVQPDCNVQPDDGILEEVLGYYPKPDKPTRVKKADKIALSSQSGVRALSVKSIQWASQIADLKSSLEHTVKEYIEGGHSDPEAQEAAELAFELLKKLNKS